MGGRVLVSGGSSDQVEKLRLALDAKGYDATVWRSASEQPGPFDVVLALGGIPAESAPRLGDRTGARSIIVLDATPDVAKTVAALRAGAADYVTDLDDIDAIDAALHRVLERQILQARLSRNVLEAAADDAEEVLLGDSVPMRRVRATLERLRNSDSTVLVTGESGTGKEVVARFLHQSGRRRNGPFVAVSCAALAPHLVESEFFGHARGAFTGAAMARRGLLVEASNGTLFLDEVPAMPLATQAKLLRVIQQRTVRPLGNATEVEFDARLVAASNIDLERAVAEGTFREDLFFRLNVVQIRLPPLRERGLDLLLLAQHFIVRSARASGKQVLGMTPGAARALVSYEFPGNVRELCNVVEAAVALTRHDHVTEGDLVPHLQGAGLVESGIDDSGLASWNTLEARHIADVLSEVRGNKAEAARLLGIDRKTLYRKLRRYGLDGRPE
jgi:two-component system response regulator AtoC